MAAGQKNERRTLRWLLETYGAAEVGPHCRAVEWDDVQDSDFVLRERGGRASHVARRTSEFVISLRPFAGLATQKEKDCRKENRDHDCDDEEDL